MMKSTVAVRGLTVVRGGRPVLTGLDLEIGHGVTGLLGPSGCGKTTLLRSLVGVQRIEGGTVEVLGQSAGSAPLRDRIGYVTQDSSVYLDLTVTENLRFFARVLGVGADEVDRAVEAVDLASHRDALAGNLSGGQLSRVSLAVALLGKPDLLVLDEPTVGLDPVLRRDLWELFHRIAEAGATVAVVKTVMEAAATLSVPLLVEAGIADSWDAAH